MRRLICLQGHGWHLQQVQQCRVQIKHIFADNQFQSSLEAIQDELKVILHFSAAQEHVPEAKWNIQTVKDTIRSTVASVPHTHRLNVMVKMLVVEATT